DKRYGWDEFPKIRDDGSPDYPFSVLYQRRLAMTDHVQHWETSPPPDQVLIPQKEPGQLLPAQKKWVMNPIYKWRFTCSPQPFSGTTAEEVARAKIKVPFYPTNRIAINQQYKAPTFYAKKMIQSFAYHELKKPYAKDPSYRAVSVQVYKVVHNVASSVEIA